MQTNSTLSSRFAAAVSAFVLSLVLISATVSVPAEAAVPSCSKTIVSALA